MGVPELLEECESCLRIAGNIFEGDIKRSERTNEVPPTMLVRSFTFGLSVVRASALLVHAGSQNGLLVAILSRSFFETAARMLWAVRTEDGWQRLQAYYADEDRKWATEARNFAKMADIAERVSRHRAGILARTDELGKKYRRVPDMRELLREIEGHGSSQQAYGEPIRNSAFVYSNVYKLLCRSTHGHMQVLGRPDSPLRHATTCIVYGTVLLLRSTCEEISTELAHEIEASSHSLLKCQEAHLGQDCSDQ